MSDNILPEENEINFPAPPENIANKLRELNSWRVERQNLYILSGAALSLRSEGKTEVFTLKLSDISLAKSFNLSLDLAVRIVLYPLLAKDLAISKPIPEDAPVTNTKVFLVSICFINLSFRFKYLKF